MKNLNPSWRPVTFTSESIDKIKHGLMTRMIRPIYPQPEGQSFIQEARTPLHWRCPDGPEPEKKWRCSYGVVGDRLWVRQVWARVEQYPGVSEDYRMPIPWKVEKNSVLLKYWRKRVIFLHDFPGKKPEECGLGSSDNVWRSPGTMPRWASWLALEITEIQAQRFEEISPKDLHAADVETTLDSSASKLWSWHVAFRKIEKGTS